MLFWKALRTLNVFFWASEDIERRSCVQQVMVDLFGTQAVARTVEQTGNQRQCVHLFHPQGCRLHRLSCPQLSCGKGLLYIAPFHELEARQNWTLGGARLFHMNLAAGCGGVVQDCSRRYRLSESNLPCKAERTLTLVYVVVEANHAYNMSQLSQLGVRLCR